MQRREFLAASAAAVAGLATRTLARAADAGTQGRQFFELRTYQFASAAKQAAFEQFMEQAAVPALSRAEIEPVGVFKLLAAENPSLKLTADPAELRILLPHNSIESFLTMGSKLGADAAFQTAGQAILRAPKADPAFTRYDSTLLLAMEGAPRLIPPAKNDERVFELRTYESPNQERARNKLDMFNAGEFAIFAKAGIIGVFFGGALVGQGLPQLTYMVAHADLASAKSNWAAFGKDPDWKKLKSIPEYADNVSKVISLFIRPAGGSQV
jgi:hypothetical protein